MNTKIYEPTKVVNYHGDEVKTNIVQEPIPYKMHSGIPIELKKGMDYDGFLLSPGGEICICAAVKISDGYIVRGHRHSDCYRTLTGILKYKGVYIYGTIYSLEDGFMTTRNRFVDRNEGLKLQLAAGIKSVDREGSYRGDELYSEDLY